MSVAPPVSAIDYLSGPWKPVCKNGHQKPPRNKVGTCLLCCRERDAERRKTPEFKRKKSARERARRAKHGPAVVARERLKRGMPSPTRPDPGLCEVCGAPPTGRCKTLALDHDHLSGKFRGWLCNTCNRGIGLLGDRLDVLRNAVAYLEAAQ